MLAACLAWTLASPALAGNDRGYHFGAEAATTAGAGVATTTSGEAVWYNPAGLAGLDATRLSVNASAFVLRSRPVDPFVTTTLGPDQTETMPIDSTLLSSVPTTVVMGRSLGPKVGLGVAVITSAHDRTIFGDLLDVPWRLDGEDGRYLQSLQLFREEQTYQIGVGAGFQVTPSLRLGTSLFFAYARRLETWSFSSTVQAPDSVGASDLIGNLTSDTRRNLLGPNLRVALQWQMTSNASMAFTVRSPSFAVATWGVATRSGVTDLTPDGRIVGDASREEGLTWGFTPFEPLRIGLAFGGTGASWWWGVEGELVFPQDAAPLTPPRTWTGNVSIGARGQVARTVQFGAGLFTDLSGIVEEDAGFEAFFLQAIDWYGVTAGPEIVTPLPIPSRDRTLKLSSSFSVRYALGVGTFGAVSYAPADIPGLVSDPASVLWHDVQLGLGTTLHL